MTVFKKVREYPWRLCRRGGGDHAHDGWATGEEAVRQNLEELKEQREPSEPTTWKIWTLLQDEQGFPIKQLILAIMLLGDVPWGAVTTEQQHASCSLMHKFHPEWQLATLLLKAFVHCLERLLPKQEVEDKQVEQLKTSLAKLCQKNPYKTGGRHIYLKELHDMAHK